MQAQTSSRQKIDLKPVFAEFSDDEFQMRLLEKGDYDKGIFELLNELTVATKLPRELYEEIAQDRLDNHLYYTIVIEDVKNKVVIGTGTLFGERKLGRNGGICVHVEDVVVLKAYAGKKFGSRIMNALIRIAKSMGGYKVILDCFKENAAFYEKFGFKSSEIQMSLRFNVNEEPTKAIEIE